MAFALAGYRAEPGVSGGSGTGAALGGGHHALAESLHTIGDMFEARARVQATVHRDLLAILSIVLLVCMVSLVIFALLAVVST